MPPLLSIPTILSAPKLIESEVKSDNDLLNAFGFSSRLVMSLNSIPALGNPDTVLMWSFKSIL